MPAILLCAATLLWSTAASAADEVHWTAAEKPLADQIKTLRDVDDAARANVMQKLAHGIQELPASTNKLRLALDLAGKSTEGDFGQPTVQAAATTLESALREKPMPYTPLNESGKDEYTDSLLPAYGYDELAQLERYEHAVVSLSGDRHYRAAQSALKASDAKRKHLDFALSDRSGKTWRLSDLRGQVVLVNFWATWCPPCRKEIPDLESLYQRFAAQGLVVLGISDEQAPKMDAYLKTHPINYHVLLDSDRVVNKQFAIRGIPKSFVYDRSGMLVAEAMDMRTQRQFLNMLAAAGLN